MLHARAFVGPAALVLIIACGAPAADDSVPETDELDSSASQGPSPLTDTGAAGQVEEAGHGSFEMSGQVLKGPFAPGSVVQVEALDAQGQPLGVVVETEIVDELGAFRVALEPAPGFLVQSTGLFYNEATQARSGQPLTLKALFVPKAAGPVRLNVNLVTHLTVDRVRRLMAEGIDMATAIERSERELRSTLGIGPRTPEWAKSGGEMDFLGVHDSANAYLLAVSCVLAEAAAIEGRTRGISADVALAELLADLSHDFAEDASLSSAAHRLLVQAMSTMDTAAMREGLEQRLAMALRGQGLAGFEAFAQHDQDDDGVFHRADNCMFVANPGQADGNGDGFGDACEPCREPLSNGAHADADSDGVVNACDVCPWVYDPEQLDNDGDDRGDACPDWCGGCSTFDDQCPEGQRCVPASCDVHNNGAWDRPSCVPSGSRQKGESCAHLWEAGLGETCDRHLMCWGGTCHELCSGSPSEPACRAEGEHCLIGGSGDLALCLRACDPFAPDCPGERPVCIPGSGDPRVFMCVHRGCSDCEMGTRGDVCLWANSCQAGHLCVEPGVVDADGCEGEHCCTSLCRLDGGACPGPRETCVPALEDPLPGFEHIGVCVIAGAAKTRARQLKLRD